MKTTPSKILSDNNCFNRGFCVKRSHLFGFTVLFRYNTPPLTNCLKKFGNSVTPVSAACQIVNKWRIKKPHLQKLEENPYKIGDNP